MKKWYKNNNKKNKYSFKSGSIEADGVGEIESDEVGEALLKKGQLEEVDAPTVGGDDEAPETAPDAETDTTPDAGTGDEPDAPWTIEDAAAKLAAEPDLLDEDEDFTKSGVPEVAALEVVFERDFTAAERNLLWEMVVKIKAEGGED